MIEQHATPGRRKIALALQGGGSHGAFTWGVIDRLLEEPTTDIIGLTGTSAGAMNGTVLVDGLLRGGPTQASAGLRRYWQAVGAMPGFGSLLSNVSGEVAAMTPLESIPACNEMMAKSVALRCISIHPPAAVNTYGANRFRSLAFAGGDSTDSMRDQRLHRETAHLHQSRNLGRCRARFGVLAAVLSCRRN